MNQDPASFAPGRVRPIAAPLDYPRLVAALAAHQASTRTANVAIRLGGVDRSTLSLADALADVIEGQAGWTKAAATLAGRFHGETEATVTPGQRT